MWGRVDVDIMINYLALQDESYQNMLRILQKNAFDCIIFDDYVIIGLSQEAA